MAAVLILAILGALGGGAAYYELVYLKKPTGLSADTLAAAEAAIADPSKETCLAFRKAVSADPFIVLAKQQGVGEAALVKALGADASKTIQQAGKACATYNVVRVDARAATPAPATDAAAAAAAGVASTQIPASGAATPVVTAYPILSGAPLTWQTGGTTKALDCSGGSCRQGAPVQSWDLNGNDGQKWTFVPSGTDPSTGTLQSGGMCLDVPNSAKTNGTQVQAWPCNQTGAQTWQWYAPSDSHSSLLNPQSNKCLDVSGGNTANGTKVQLWDCLKNDAQTWIAPGSGFVTSNSAAIVTSRPL